MSSEYVGIEEARKRLGDLVTAVQQGADVTITRNGKPAVRLIAFREPTVTTYTAAIGTASDVVDGDFCDVSVIENEIVSYRVDDENNEIPVYSMTDRVAMPAQELDVRTDDEDKLSAVGGAADDMLAAHGWTRTGDWDVADNALYATVELA